LGDELSALPHGNWLVRLEEINRLYPAVYAEFRQVREAAVDRLLDQSLDAARRDGALRDDLHPDILRAIFWSSVIGLIENPALISANVSLAEVLTTVREVFWSGISRRPYHARPAVTHLPPQLPRTANCGAPDEEHRMLLAQSIDPAGVSGALAERDTVRSRFGCCCHCAARAATAAGARSPA